MPAVWTAFSESEDESYSAESLATEGFIHCSFEEQLPGVLARYYSGAGKVILLELDPSKLTETLKIEPSTNGELYPHVYGPISRDSILAVIEKALEPSV